MLTVTHRAIVFATAMVAIMPASVHAASTSTVSIGNTSSNVTAFVAGTRQLETVTTAPNNVVSAFESVGPGCGTLYTPPPGKAVVVTQITYDLGSGTQGTESFAELGTASCSSFFDIADTVQAFEAQSHTFPTGLPLPSVDIEASGGSAIFVSMTGYLIPATQLPSAPPAYTGPMKRAPRTR